MATKSKLIGSLGSLSDTLTNRWDPGAPQEVAARWLAVMTHVAAVTHRSVELLALPDDSTGYDPVIADLDDATHSIVVAATATAKLRALAQGDTALEAVEALLGA